MVKIQGLMRAASFFVLFCTALFGQPLQVEVSARSAVLMNAETGAIRYAKEAEAPTFPASITKIATATFFLDEKRLDLQSLTTISAEALRLKGGKGSPPYAFGGDGSSMGLLRGERVSFESLLHGLLLVSGNDAANAMAEAASGSIPLFMEELNQYLKRLGCKNTHFVNPHGYHHPEHQTTALDMATLARRALQLPVLCDVVKKTSYVKPKTNRQQPLELKQTNSLVKKGKYFYPKALGMKTGYHSAAQNTLIAAAKDQGRLLVAVILGAPTSGQRFEDARRLFEAAFNESKIERLLVSKGNEYTRLVMGGKIPLRASLAQDLVTVYYPSEEKTLRAYVQWEEAPFPIRKGARVGEIRAVDEQGALIAKGELLAAETVEATFFFALKERLNQFWR
jgi:D-alanyl-D-alanine carboxypeptidase (penicillin-binding protein 5/6)